MKIAIIIIIILSILLINLCIMYRLMWMDRWKLELFFERCEEISLLEPDKVVEELDVEIKVYKMMISNKDFNRSVKK